MSRPDDEPYKSGPPNIAGYCTYCGSPLNQAQLKALLNKQDPFSEYMKFFILIGGFMGLLFLFLAGLTLVGVI